MKRGVLIASDASQEIFIPWWYEHYTKHNDYPIAVVDLGLSAKAKGWIEHIGIHIPFNSEVPALNLQEKNDAADMKGLIEHVQSAHEAWVKKPAALAHTPFEQTVWLDLDCEVRCDLTPVFDSITEPCHFAPTRDAPHYEKWCSERGVFSGKTILGYDSAVVAYRQTSPVLSAWIEAIATWDRPFWGDDRILSEVIAQSQFPIHELPAAYCANPWREHSDAQILHWATPHGKAAILRQMLLQL